MLRKSNTKLHSLKGSIHADSPSKGVSKQMLEAFTKLDSIKKNPDLDAYGKKSMAKKYLQSARENIYASMGDVAQGLQEQYATHQKELFSSNRALGQADIVMLPVAYENFKNGNIDYKNKNSAQMLLQLNAQGLVPDSVVHQVDSIQTPTVVEKLEGIEATTNQLGSIKQEFEREVNSIFPDIDNFEEII